MGEKYLIMEVVTIYRIELHHETTKPFMISKEVLLKGGYYYDVDSNITTVNLLSLGRKGETGGYVLDMAECTLQLSKQTKLWEKRVRGEIKKWETMLNN